MVLINKKLNFFILIFFYVTIPFMETFKNVEVLDISSRSEMKKYMKSISKDLGVKCSYCHDMDDKSIETPLKDVTREMIKLTRYLNDVLNVEKNDSTKHKTFITCWTCHHGKVSPQHKRPEQ
tara:strand:- start:1035 stop:1400 length:366 start_codon:yes stop_codon:yes gene_type:complete